MKIDYLSDTHLDFWVNATKPNQHKLLKQLVDKIVPEESVRSKVLIIPGDIGHYNYQNAVFFEILTDYYEKVLWVHGNHDLYMITNSMQKEYNYNSLDKLSDMAERSDKIPNVHFLHGDKITIDGKVFGGTGMWYDFEYSRIEWKYNKDMSMRLWHSFMNDSRLIKLGKREEFDPLKYFKEEYSLMEPIISDLDVIISHVSPDWSRLVKQYIMPSSTFYHFDGSKLLEKTKQGSHWLYGHTHTPYHYTHKSGCVITCNPLGYPNERNIKSDITFRNGIKTIKV